MSTVRAYTSSRAGKRVLVRSHTRHVGTSWLTHAPSRSRSTPSLLDAQQKKRAKDALKALGYSAHTRSPRFGPKAQVARWGLGHERRLPKEYEHLGR